MINLRFLTALGPGRLLPVLLISSFLAAPITANSEELECTEAKVFSWLSNFTWGGVNTALGAVWGSTVVASPGAYFLLAVPSEGPIEISDTHAQLSVAALTIPYSFEVSLGNIHIFDGFAGSRKSGHESEHAYQSAVLGPLYLPVTGLSYLYSLLEYGLYLVDDSLFDAQFELGEDVDPYEDSWIEVTADNGDFSNLLSDLFCDRGNGDGSISTSEIQSDSVLTVRSTQDPSITRSNDSKSMLLGL